MGKVVVTFNEIIELNQLLKEENLQFKVHLHDACGYQSFTIESLGESKEEEVVRKMADIITGYFNNKRMQIQFSTDQLSFQIITEK